MSARGEIVDWARACYEDLRFGEARRWLEEGQGRKACGHLPVYAPRELVHASGMPPVGIYGGGDLIEIIRGDAFYQSYIFHLPRSVVELAQSGRLDFLSAMLFPSTCDVIRNLSGMWQVLYPGLYVRYLDVPQVRDPSLATRFWVKELQTLVHDLGEVSGAPVDEAARRGRSSHRRCIGGIRFRRGRRRGEPAAEAVLRGCRGAGRLVADGSWRR